MNWGDYMHYIVFPIACLFVWLYLSLIANWSTIRETAHRYLSSVLAWLGIRRDSKPLQPKRGQGKVRRHPRKP